MATRNWLITGGSSGLGRSLAMAAQRQGHQVVATARNISKAAEVNPEFEKLGGKWLQLDVQDPATQETVRKTIQEQNVNVVVNNAGIALLGAFEDMSEEELYEQMNTNFFGAVRVMKGAIPIFRERKGGAIVNVSSAAAFIGVASRSIYGASKSALETMSEAIATELAGFNIRVLIVDPGAFETNFVGAHLTPKSQKESGGISKPYAGSIVDTIMTRTRGLVGTAPGDPDEAASRIIESVTEQGMAGSIDLGGHQRLILGSDSLKRAREQLANIEKNCNVMETVAASTDFKKS